MGLRLDPNHHRYESLIPFKGSHVLDKHSSAGQSLGLSSQEERGALRSLHRVSLSLSASSGLAPHLYLSPQPFPSFLSLLPSFPSIPASDTYSLASEYFLFLFPRVRLVGEAFPGLLPALPEVKCRCRTGFCQPSSNFTSQPLLGTHCAPGPSHELSHSLRARTLWGRVTICTGQMSGPVLGAVQ